MAIAALTLTACIDLEADRRVISSGVLAVGPRTVVVAPVPALSGIGPTTELCVTLPGAYEYRGEIGDRESWTLRRPDGVPVALTATLVAPDGTREGFDETRIRVGSAADPDHVLCFERETTRDRARRYERIELQAADTLHVLTVRWDSGKRFASL